jgi:hypothetical protein
MIKTAFYLLVALLFLANCDPAKKIQRICQKHPDVCRNDTIETIVRDTFLVKEFAIDTTFNFEDYITHDTVFLVKNNVVVKYKYNPASKTVYLGFKAAEQKHIFEHKITIVNREVTFKKHWSDYLALAITIITGFFFIKTLLLNQRQKLANPAREN